DKVDEFHDQKIAKLLARGVQMDSDDEDIDEEEEVMALEDSEEEEEEEEEQQEEAEEEEEEGTDMELPNEMAWGRKKKMFYDSDYVQSGKQVEVLEAEEQEEEEEAKNIQKRLAANLSEEDYDLSFFQEFATAEDEGEDEEKAPERQEKIVKDLQQMTKKEKMKLLKKESPELLELIQDFKTKLTELKDELQPLVQMVKDGKIPEGKAVYCTNISFYLVLKAKRLPAHNHPVIERLLSYRNLINDLAAVDARLAPEFRRLLSGEEEDSDSDLDEEAALRFYREAEERVTLKRMAKNKGLTPKRKKIDRNPRVKHREKFRRAKIRRKGQVRQVRREETKYSGELSGIRAGVKKSVKLN
uniref:UTP3 small subunit processome component n=1 Tax=Cynoglossus semilaevis TaxID=244447 RepID=A0A3P8X2F6_CYNSE